MSDDTLSPAYWVPGFVAGYLSYALWLDTTEGEDDSYGTPLGETDLDLAPSTMDKLRAEALDFLSQPGILEAINPEGDGAYGGDGAGGTRWWPKIESAGGDFYLTRNGHGTGFWDRGDDMYTPEARTLLTEACRPYGEASLYVGDDNLIYTP